MKVLLSAYSCLPTAGSEPAIGWNWARYIAAAGHDVVVVTRAINQKEIAGYCSKESIRNPRFIFHDLSSLVQKFYKLPFGNYVYYMLWQYTAAEKAARAHENEHFDRVQHVTWGSFRLPSFMGRLGIPFIFGPVAGGEDTPKLLRKGLGLRGRLWDSMRRFSNSVFALVPFMRSTYEQAAEIVATTAETHAAIPAAYRGKSRIQMAVGIGPSDFGDTALEKMVGQDRPKRAQLNLLYVGRLVPWKGLQLGLHALAKLGERAADVHLTVIGSGSDESRLKNLARSLRLENSVTWLRWIPREDLLRKYSSFDLFLFPSLHDSGGMAVLEAMWFGLPVLCLDLGGPGVSVDSTSGRVVVTAGRNEEQVAEAIAEFLREALADPARLTRLSEGARRRVRSLTWEANVRTLYPGSLVTQAQGGS